MGTMKALVRDRYGSLDDLELRDIEQPVPLEDEVLVRVHATSLNDWDLALLKRPPLVLRPVAPWVPIVGSDIAGRVEAVGKAVTRFRPGDDVCGDLSRFGRGGFGGFAEYVCARETALVPKPARMTYEQAAALPQAGVLALQGLRAGGPLRAGQRILINGAGGGVGTLAVQVAKLHDVEITGVDSAAKLDMMRSIGFDHVIDYTQTDFTSSANRYDLIVDTKSERSPFACARALNPHGTYATVGGVPRRIMQVVLFGPWIRRTSNKTVRMIALKQNRDLPYLTQLFEAGKLAPVIDGHYTLSEAREAFRHVEAAHHKGKVVITMA
jgi:NADPH:quinone reductase-like Zn-dependent oxidoreductase